MITLLLFIGLAIRNLRRGGQRIYVALACIAFGIMALVALSMLAKSIESTVVISPSELLGGDISMGRSGQSTVSAEDIAQLDALKQDGQISSYTLIAFTSNIMIHTQGASDMHFIPSELGIEADKYPLAGKLAIGEPGSTGLRTLLQQVGDVIVTRDVAEQYGLKVGDGIVLADLDSGIPVQGLVRAIAYDTPNHMGQKLYYSLATAQAMSGGQPVVNTVMVNTPQGNDLISKLEATGWSVDYVAGREEDRTANIWVVGLRGAGILGLLVGGVGIANTMQVLLKRRQKEIAVWKTLGYRESDLRLVFVLEAGILGLVGSAVGAILGVAASMGLLEVFRRTSTLLYEWHFFWTPPLIGVLVGTISTILFAYWAIVMSSRASPMALMRNESLDVRKMPLGQSAALALILTVLFALATSIAMGSVLSGIEVLVAIVIGMGLLVGIFKFLLWLITRVFRLRRFPLAGMGFRRLRKNGSLAMVFAMIALFIGVITMSLGLLVVQLSMTKIGTRPTTINGTNIDVLASAADETAVRKIIEAQNPLGIEVGYRARLADDSSRVSNSDALLIGRSTPVDYAISGAAWGSRRGGVYVPSWSELAKANQVEITLQDGSKKMLPIVGTYEFCYDAAQLNAPVGFLMTADDFKQLAQPDLVTFFVKVDQSHLDGSSQSLGSSLPQATVINLADYAERYMQSYRNLFILPISMAGLAFLAGLLLVANSVSLGMLERRYEIGILKTVGYSQRQVLSVFVVEYGLIGLISTGAGVLIVQALIALFAIGNRMPPSLLLLSVPSTLVVIACGIGLTVLTVVGISRKPTQVSPVVVLNERE